MSAASPRKRRPPVARHFKLDELLSDEMRLEYEGLLCDRGTTVDVAHAWLAERKVLVSRSAVARHRRHFLATAADREAHDRAVQTLLDTARACGPVTMADALLGASQTMLILRLAAIVEETQTTPLSVPDLLAMVRAVDRSLKTRRQLEASRAAAPEAPGDTLKAASAPAPSGLTAAEAQAALDSVEERVAQFLKDNPFPRH